ncbi:MAG: hypothetical protein IT379_18930 [Deltaproteobacteria bacterium]|nr:hypothetical protein [Deltaproteobacteria bacterium]
MVSGAESEIPHTIAVHIGNRRDGGPQVAREPEIASRNTKSTITTAIEDIEVILTCLATAPVIPKTQGIQNRQCLAARTARQAERRGRGAGSCDTSVVEEATWISVTEPRRIDPTTQGVTEVANAVTIRVLLRVLHSAIPARRAIVVAADNHPACARRVRVATVIRAVVVHAVAVIVRVAVIRRAVMVDILRQTAIRAATQRVGGEGVFVEVEVQAQADGPVAVHPFIWATVTINVAVACVAVMVTVEIPIGVAVHQWTAVAAVSPAVAVAVECLAGVEVFGTVVRFVVHAIAVRVDDESERCFGAGEVSYREGAGVDRAALHGVECSCEDGTCQRL